MPLETPTLLNEVAVPFCNAQSTKVTDVFAIDTTKPSCPTRFIMLIREAPYASPRCCMTSELPLNKILKEVAGILISRDVDI